MEKHTGQITVGNLVKLRECTQKKKFSELTLKSFELERRFHVCHALDVLKECMFAGKPHDEAISAMLQALEQGYQDEWFALTEEKNIAYAKDEGRLKRIASFLYAKEAKVIGIDVPYSLDLSPVSYRGVEFSCVTGKANMVFEKDGQYEAIMFSQKEPEFSHVARREDTKPINSIELLCMKLGLEERYPGVTCSIYYLKNKDDKGLELKPFEHKRGKNIVSQDYATFSTAQVLEKLYSAVALPVNVKCADCVFMDVCKFPRTIREDAPVAERIPYEGNKPHFTEAQEKVVHHVNGPMNVMAVPGAGKTFALVQRMLHLIRVEGIKPTKILFVTFTKKACEEIRERVEAALGTSDESKLPHIFTFNALGYQILKDNPALIGRRVKLADTVDKLSIIREVLDLVPQIKDVSYEGLYEKYGLIHRLEREFNQLDESGEDVWKKASKLTDTEGVLVAYKKYKEIFEERELVTYDMQITLCNMLFEKRPDLAKLYSRIFSYIMVDEFQDVSADNVRLIYSIAKHHNNIVVVGDDDQSIYSFRGGSNRYLMEFSQDFPDAQTVIMGDNFRSNDKILEAASVLIKNNQERMQKEMIAHMENSYRPILLRDFMPERLPKLISSILKKGYGLGDIAVLGRYNKTLNSVLEVLSPTYKCNSPKDYLIEDPVFMMMTDLLNLYYRPDRADRSVYRLFSWLGFENAMKKTNRNCSLLENVLYQNGLPLFELSNTECVATYDKIGADEGILSAAKTIFDCLSIIQQTASIEQTMRDLIRRFFQIEQHPVFRVLCDMADERGIDSMCEFDILLRDMNLFKDEKRVGYAASPDAINLLTAHDAKGKEYPVVIVCSAEEFSDTEEERRLFYVAMTRAKKSLFVTESQYMQAPLVRECEARMAIM